ncbi:lactadherin-like [Patiria miniata]|uniref:F5/8 type C domain-containing protein n=1 Tax=Patiria miniata TaxID=46514 RepID=A0A914BLU6_PATMI|nr:lactadherin-like [Patiria miniata]
MGGAVAWILMVSVLTVLSGGVEGKQRVCYFGHPPEPDTDNPDDWMKQVMQEIRERCPGRREPTQAGHTTVGEEPTPAGHTTMGKEPTTAGHTTMAKEPTPADHTTMAKEPTPAGHTTTEKEPTPAGDTTTGKTPTPAGQNIGTNTSVDSACMSPEPLGLEDGTIPSDRIRASGSSNCCPAEDGRLNLENGGWEPKRSADSWIEVDLVNSTVVLGVTTQGFNQWYVTQYKVAYQKLSSSNYEHVTDGNGDIKIFNGNTDGVTLVTNLFNESVVATVVRIEPTAWNSDVNLRFEVLGCLP